MMVIQVLLVVMRVLVVLVKAPTRVVMATQCVVVGCEASCGGHAARGHRPCDPARTIDKKFAFTQCGLFQMQTLGLQPLHL